MSKAQLLQHPTLWDWEGLAECPTKEAELLWCGSSLQLGSCKHKQVKSCLFDSASEACPESQHLKGLVISASRKIMGQTPDVSVEFRPPKVSFTASGD